jgi:hypothetical protein
VKKNVTTNESIRMASDAPQYEYLRDIQSFNGGLIDNLRELFWPTIDWFHLYSFEDLNKGINKLYHKFL